MPIFGTISGKRKLTVPVWYGISARSFFPELNPTSYLEALFKTTAELIQWREKDLPEGLLRPLVCLGAKLASQSGKTFLVNSATWSALINGADGVHLTSRADIEEALQARVQTNRPDFLVGKSVHSVEEAEQAAARGADYLILGPVFDPLSKSPELPPLGLEVLQLAVKRVSVPVFAVGGVDKTNAEAVLQTGAAGVAGISWLKEEIEEALRARL